MNSPTGRTSLFGRILFALSFLTRLPLPSWVHEMGLPEGLGSLPLFLTGLLLGGLLSLLFWVLSAQSFLPFPVSPYLRAFLLIAAWTYLTGALHLDGVADATDAAFAPVSPEEKRRIRKDPRKGAFAIVALNLFLIGKWTGILLATGPLPILLAPILARSVLPLLFAGVASGDPARPPEGLGALLLSGGSGERWIGPGLAILAAVVTERGAGGIVSLLTVGGLYLLGRFLSHRMDGPSGDLAGLLVEAGEVLFLLLSSVPMGA